MALKRPPKLFVLQIVALIVNLVKFGVVLSDCIPEDYPNDLLNCLKAVGKGTDITKIPGEIPSTYCYQCYQWRVGESRQTNKKSEYESVFENLLSNIQFSGMKRTKRDIKQKIVRKEYRMMTDEERERYHNAVNRLKEETFGGKFPNGAYNFIKDIHANEDMYSTHMGSNFLGWHRIYLRWYEIFLQRIDPEVTVPYWDATLDAENKDNAKLSQIFSEKFFGDSDLNYGPYKDWDFVRNIGVYGDLLNADEVKLILQQRSNLDINFHTRMTNIQTVFEMKHGKMHTFVNGDLGLLRTSTNDPIFFSLHSYVDYIWEKFRQSIQNPTEYPDNAVNYPNHKSTDKMPFFSNMTVDNFRIVYNRDGYSNFWTKYVYEYEESPAFDCDRCESSQYLTCDERTRRCRALLIGEKKITRTKRSPKRFFVPPPFRRFKEEKTCPKLTCPVDVAVQNTFRVNENRTLPNVWKFMPFEVLYKRPPGLRFRSYKMYYGHREKNQDLFDNGEIETSPRLATNKYCLKSASGYTRVFINVYGVSYGGLSTDYAILDQRFPISSAYAYVPVKSPTPNEDAQIAVTAYDECGRLCRPLCKRANGEYSPCSGVIRLKGSHSTSCQSTVKDVVSHLWRYEQNQGVEQEHTSALCVKIVCDHSLTFPWDDYKTKIYY